MAQANHNEATTHIWHNYVRAPNIVLIHAGDLTNQETHAELFRAVSWLESAGFECKLVVAVLYCGCLPSSTVVLTLERRTGNHDITLDRAFYAHHGSRFNNQVTQHPEECQTLLESSPTITYLCHESADIRLQSNEGPRTTFTVFGSPYSPRDGNWAFSYQPAVDGCPPSSAAVEAAGPVRLTSYALWSEIPVSTDILVTHTPPRSHCDWSATRSRHGHVHEGRGAEWVHWGATSNSALVERWDDPGSGKKMSIVNAAAHTGRSPRYGAGHVGASHSSFGETCIVNCAITATTYPHLGGKRLHKPIVVDLHLPVCDDAYRDI
ncbi:uncharacterized protein SPSK_09508 [Sporothrix schenckii 1099-18]|uniref:Calcineurin-like phosphoesterase domain-containing protein n=1 Tax=Sporothrix schenckii 1099-18 TaxID=1397361 RepID=A0A0F2M5A8_SPOSC|nr:uncharacterized protein SPSK_09508 [Sporothrix schenckii 1099-18]KJR84893.1 hypothetical protein SPSK_09508 [Sporothrix schenckii 1099-18]